VLHHELNEAAEIVRQNPGGASKEAIGAQLDSVVMKKGAATGAKPTAHDVAAANEIVELYNEWQRHERTSSPEAPHRKGVFDRAMEAQGLNEDVETAAKKDLLKSNGAPQELIDRVGKGAWKTTRKNFNAPVNHGEWLGDRADSGWIDDRPEVIRIVGRGPDGRANPIVFRQGVADFTPWSRGELSVEGLNGQHPHDMPIIRLAIAEREGLAPGESVSKRRDAARAWLKDANDGYGGKGLRPHHAGGNRIQLIPADVHQVSHTDLSD
jgi:hypothetical protein